MSSYVVKVPDLRLPLVRRPQHKVLRQSRPLHLTLQMLIGSFLCRGTESARCLAVGLELV